jgi:hypothetical protein
MSDKPLTFVCWSTIAKTWSRQTRSPGENGAGDPDRGRALRRSNWCGITKALVNPTGGRSATTIASVGDPPRVNAAARLAEVALLSRPVEN